MTSGLWLLVGAGVTVVAAFNVLVLQATAAGMSERTFKPTSSTYVALAAFGMLGEVLLIVGLIMEFWGRS